MQKYHMELDKQKFMMEMEKKNYQNMVQMHEVEQERQRRQRKSKQFQYNNISLHNPITNPIEYHIDNPYILKKIQDRTLGWLIGLINNYIPYHLIRFILTIF